MLFILYQRGFPGSSAGKESTCNAGDLDSTPGLGRSTGGWHGNPLQYSCLENPPGQRSLVGQNPWGRKESETTQRLSTSMLFILITILLARLTVTCGFSWGFTWGFSLPGIKEYVNTFYILSIFNFIIFCFICLEQ